MPEEKEKKSEFSLANIGYLLAAVLAGSIFVGQDPYHESRPDQLHTAWYSNPDFQDVDARLWQDPFDAVQQYKHEKVNEQARIPSIDEIQPHKRGKTKENTQNLALDSLEKNHKPEVFSNEIKNKTHDGQTPVVIAVLLPGGRYYEDSETRRRIRYAVLSGFNAALEYVPDDSEHIGFFKFEPKNENLNLKTEVVYERVAEPSSVFQPHNKVVGYILYLNSDNFKNKPCAKLSALFNNVMKNCAEKCQINLLGPYRSELLRDLAVEINSENNQNGDKRDSCNISKHNFRIYSPSATTDPIKLLGLDENKNASNTTLDKLLSKFNFKQVSSTDDKLAETLRVELKKRQVDIQSLDHETNSFMKFLKTFKKDKHIVLISEKEYLYGWHIGDTFAEKLAHCLDEDTRQVCQRKMKPIHQFSYFRGLDGEKPRKAVNNGSSTETNTDGEAVRSTTDNEARSKAMESADGDSQFDYIRRLVNQLDYLENQLEHEGGMISAIGILGSDVYDKLLVLEAMHEKFPQVLYFTNGMDARFLQPDKNKYARNLIVTSSFGLFLEKESGLSHDEDWQWDIPPFRDDSQTAYFLATEMALWDSYPHIQYQIGYIPEYIQPAPQIHEIGRTKAFYLASDEQENNSITNYERRKNFQIPSPYQAKTYPKNYNLPADIQLLALVAIYTLFIIGVWQYFSRQLETNYVKKVDENSSRCFCGKVKNFFSYNKQESEKYKVLCRQRWFTLASLILVMVVFVYGVCRLHDNLTRVDEPLAWLEGVSIWPTELIRFLAIIVAVNGIIDVWHWPETMRELLLNKLNIKENDEFTNYVNSESLYFGLSIKYLIVKFIFLVALSIILTFGFGNLNIPARGDLVFDINGILFIIFLLFALSSYILVTGRTQAVIRYIGGIVNNYFNNQESPLEKVLQIELPAGRMAWYQELEMPLSELPDWITIRVISEITVEVNRLILYPLIVAALHVLSRMSYFDNYISPPGLLFGLALYFAYLIYCDYRLKTVAEEAEKIAINHLRRRLVRSYAAKNAVLSLQLEKLVERSEQYAELAYKPFLHRPIFQGMMLVLIAVALDYSDYSTLMLKIFK